MSTDERLRRAEREGDRARLLAERGRAGVRGRQARILRATPHGLVAMPSSYKDETIAEGDLDNDPALALIEDSALDSVLAAITKAQRGFRGADGRHEMSRIDREPFFCEGETEGCPVCARTIPLAAEAVRLGSQALRALSGDCEVRESLEHVSRALALERRCRLPIAWGPAVRAVKGLLSLVDSDDPEVANRSGSPGLGAGVSANGVRVWVERLSGRLYLKTVGDFLIGTEELGLDDYAEPRDLLRAALARAV